MTSRNITARFDFRERVAYNHERKQLFHRQAKRQLRVLATALRLQRGDYDLCSNTAGIAVSGEVTLHGDHLYVQVSQPATGSDTGVLFRSCTGRRDYVGGRNHFAGLDMLHAPNELAALIGRHIQR
ncbi:MAG TPA: hypothetical protein VHY35_05370 [Stellaceae bacterium]|jgi:hypothetical protein|nr:hypothetical protein [Stellaceae bacterium]